MIQRHHNLLSKMPKKNIDSNESVSKKICKALYFALIGSAGENTAAIVTRVLTNTILANSMLTAFRYCSNSFLDSRNSALTSVNVEALANTAIASLNYHSGIYLLEQHLQVLHTMGNNEELEYRTVVQLGRLYGALEEKDILSGMLFQLSPRTDARHALDVEISKNDYSEAIRLYNDLLIANDTGENGDVSFRDVEMWEKRSLGCIASLLDWKQLHEKVNTLSTNFFKGTQHDVSGKNFILRLYESGIPGKDGGDLMWLLPHYTQSISKLGGYVVSPLRFSSATYGHEMIDSTLKGGVLMTELWEETSEFLSCALQPPTVSSTHELAMFQQTKSFLEANHPSDLSLCYVSMSLWSRAQAFVDMSYDRFLEAWSSLHPSASTARNTLLCSLQKILEIEDTVSLLSPLAGGSAGHMKHTEEKAVMMETKLEKILQRWHYSNPQSSDSLNVWDDLARVRSLCLSQYVQYQADFTDSSKMTTDDDSCTSHRLCGAIAAADHLGDFHVKIAISAIDKNILQVGKEELSVASTYRKAVANIESQQLGRRKAKGQLANLSLNEVLTVCAFNQRGIETAIQGSGAESKSSSLLDVVVPRFQKTMDLLRNKQSLCQTTLDDGGHGATIAAGNQEKILELLRVQLLQAEWTTSWGYFLQKFTLDGSFGVKFNEAFQMFRGVSSQAEKMLNVWESSAVVVNKEFGQLSGEVQGKFAKFCDDLLTNNIGGVGDGSKSTALVAINSYLSGMIRGDSLCRARVLRLLCLAGEYLLTESSISTLKKGRITQKKAKVQPSVLTASQAAVSDLTSLMHRIRTVPPWMYLRFAAQIMGCIDRPEGPIAVAILEHVAAAYPRALYYPFKVSYPSLSAEGKAMANAKLSGLLRDDLTDLFVQSLTGLTHPELRWTDGLKNIVTLLELRKEEEAEAALDELQEVCAGMEWSGIGDKIGDYNAKYARYRCKTGKASKTSSSTSRKRASSSLSSAASVALLSSLNSSFDVKGIRGLLKKAQGEDDGWRMKFKSGKVPLTEFSHWLAEFGSLTLTLSSLQYATGDVTGALPHYNYANIEVPGQYNAAIEMDMPPCPEHHSIILAIHPELLVMSSIRKPKRMGVIGSGGVLAYFLVKGGEDLRNDQRIEELFVLMNRIVREDSANPRVNSKSDDCDFSREKLQALSFNVIPMTPRVGLLEWVTNTAPLKSVITSEMERDSKFVTQNPNFITKGGDGELQFLKASEERASWVKNDYHKMFRSAKKEQAEKLYKKLINMIPNHFLRRRRVYISVLINSVMCGCV